jgi:hypothetical protein
MNHIPWEKNDNNIQGKVYPDTNLMLRHYITVTGDFLCLFLEIVWPLIRVHSVLRHEAPDF